MARAPHEPGTQAATYLGPRLLILVHGPLQGNLNQPSLQSRFLQAIDLRTGKAQWQHPVEGKPLLPPGAN